MRRALLLLVVLGLAACGGNQEAAVRELTDVAALRADFEEQTGKTRVVLLLAPT